MSFSEQRGAVGVSGGSQPPTDYLNEKQAAAYTNVSVAKLRKDRMVKRGFKYCRMGRRILYRRADIDNEMSKHLVEPIGA